MTLLYLLHFVLSVLSCEIEANKIYDWTVIEKCLKELPVCS